MNLQEKFYRWQEKMQKKSEQEQHNYAMTVALVVTAIITFFVASSWYYTITDNPIEITFLTQVVDTFSAKYDEWFGFFNNEN